MGAPQVKFNIKDNNAPVVNPIGALPLDKQAYMIIGQKGEGNVFKYFANFPAAMKEYGTETFNETNSTYFSRAAYMAKTAFGGGNGAWLMRLEPADSMKANAIVYATLHAEQIPQYTKAADGSRTLDNTGNWIPLLDAQHHAITAAGFKIVLSVEKLTGVQTIDTLTVTTTTVPDEGDFIKYPLFAIECGFSGLSGDNVGFEFYYDSAENTSDMIELLKNIKFTMRAKELQYGTSTVNFVRDIYDSVENSFTLINNVVDTGLNMNVGIDSILSNRFDDTAPLPFKVKSYEENYKTLVAAVKTHLTVDELDSLGTLAADTNAFVINVISGVNPLTNLYYDNISITNAVLLKNITNFLKDGDDGDISQTNEFVMVKNVLDLTTFPALEDQARFPMSCLVDPGYDIQTKYAMIDFLTIREDVCVAVGTYQMNRTPLSEAEDMSVGQALYARALMTEESVLYGTQACRCIIMGQSGIPNSSVKNTEMPGTMWLANQMATQLNKTYLDQPLITYPYSLNNMFKSLNWYPVKTDFKNRLWGAGINYCQYYDRFQLFYPALRSVYPYESSALVDFEFVLTCVFIKQIAREIGFNYFGSEDTVMVRHFKIQKDIETALGKMLNSKYDTTVSVYQTTEEASIGNVDHVAIEITSGPAMTLLNVDLIVNKTAAA